MNTETRLGKRFVIAAILLAITSLLNSQAATVTYTMQTGNFNTLSTERNNNPPYAGTYNNTASEIGQYANSGSFGNTPGAAAFQTFTTTGNGNTGSVRALQVGDTFTITAYTGGNPSAGGYLGISFRDSTSYANFFSSTDSATEARFQLDNTGGWKVYNSGTARDSGLGSGSDRTFVIKITSDTTFDASIGGTWYYNNTMAASGGTIDSFAIYTFGDSNQNSFWKSASLSDTGTVEVGYGLTNGGTFNPGIIANGLAANSTSTVRTNALLVGGDAGSVVVLDDANTYSGGTTINANATALAANNAAFGTNGTVTVTSGGAVQLSNNISSARAITLNGTGVSSSGGALRNVSGNNTNSGAITLGSGSRINTDSGTLTLSGGISGGANVLFVGGASNTTVNSAISGGGASQNDTTTSLYKDGAGTLMLSGNNSYTGDTRISQGNITVGSGGNLGSGSDVFIANGASLAVNANTTVAQLREWSTTNGGTASIGSGATLTVNGDAYSAFMNSISGSGALTKSGTGTMNLYGTQSYTGTTTVSAGTLSSQVGMSSTNITVGGGTFEATAANVVADTAAVTVNSGNYAVGGNDTIGSLSGSGGNVNLSNGVTLTVNESGNATYAGGITNAGGLTKTGAGTTTLSGANTYTGTTTIGGGTLALSGGSAIANTGVVSLSNASGAALAVNASETIGSLRGGGASGGNVSVASSQTLTVAETGSQTYAGAISGAGGFTKSGAGTTTLSANSSYSGATTVSAGTLAYNGNNANTAVTIASGATLSGAGSLGAVTVNGVIAPGTSPGNLSVAALTLNGGGSYQWELTDTTGAAGVGWDVITVGGGSGAITLGATSGSKFTINVIGTNPSSWAAGTSRTWDIIDGGSWVSAFDANAFAINTNSFTASGTLGTFSVANNSGNLQLVYTAAITDYTVNVPSGSANQGAATGGADQFTGAGSVIKTGAGTLVMTNGANSYTGSTTVQAGTLQINVNAPSGSAGALGNASSAVVIGDSGTTAAAGFNIGAANVTNSRNLNVVSGTGAADRVIGTTITSGTAVQAGNVNLATNATLSAASGGTMVYTGVLSNTGGITASNGGTTVLSGANTYTGTTTVGSGATLVAANNAALGATNGSTTVSSGGTLGLSNGITSAEALNVNGAGVSDGGAIRNLSGNNTLSGNVTLAGATRVNSDAGLLTMSGNVNGASNALTVGGSGNTTISGNITNSNAGLTKDGAGTATLSGANTYTGATTVSAGTLAISGGSAISDSSAVSVASGSTLQVGGTETIGSLAGAGGTVALGTNGIVVGGLNTATSYGGVITGSGSFSKNGTGTQTLSGNSTGYSGEVILNNGTLRAGSDGAFGTGTVTVNFDSGTGTRTLAAADGSSYTLNNNFNQYYDALTIGEASGGTGSLTLGGSGKTFYLGDDATARNRTNTVVGSHTIAAAVTGGNNLVKAGAGTLTLSGNNTFTGSTTVDVGTLALSGSGSLATSSRVNVGTGATFDISGVTSSASVAIISEQGNNDGGSIKLGSKNLTMTGGNTTYFVNNLGVSGDTGSFTLNAGSSTLSLYGASQYTGATTLSAGTLTTSAAMSSTSYALNGGNLTTTAGANLADNAAITLGSGSSTFTVGASDTIGSFGGTAGTVSIANSNVILTTGDSANTAFSGVISGQGALIKNGAGTFTLNGTNANTYSGNTTVNAGVLVLAKTNVNALAGTPTINSGGTIRLGAANQFAGDTTFLTVSSGGVFDMNGFNETLAIQGAGTVTLGNGTMTINPTGTDSFSGVISGSGAIVKTNTGTQILSGNSSYTGATTVGQGVLVAASANALGATNGGTTINTGTALQLSNATSMTVAENMTVNGTGVSGIGGALVNTAGANTVSGNLTLGSNARVAATGGSLNVSGNVGGGNNILFVGTEENIAISGAISGAGNTQNDTTTSLFKDGAKTLTLSGNNTYTGDTRISQGNVTVASGGSLGSGSDVFITTNGTLAVNTDTTVATLQEWGNNNGGTASVGAGATLTVNGNATNFYMNSIGGAGSLSKSGTGTMNLYGSQAYTGTTTVSGGKLSSAVALASTNVTVNGGTFEANGANILGNSAAISVASGTYELGGNDTVGSFSISGGALSGSSTLTASTYALNGGTVTANLGAGTATASSGTTALDGTLGATNVNISGGTVNLGANNRLADGAAVTVSGGTLGMGTRTDTVGSLTMSGGTLGGSGTLTASTYALNGGNINAVLGAGAITVGGGTNTLGSAGRLNSASSLTVNSGQLTLGGNEIVSSLAGTGGTVNLGANSLTLGGNSYSNRFDGVISGSGSLIKNGTGTLQLGGINTYSGGTFLNAGYLDSESASAFGFGSITVASAGTLNLESHNVTNLIINNGGTILSTGTVSDVVASNGTTSIGGSNSVVVEVSGSATVDVSGSNVTVSNVSGGTVTLSNTATGSTVNAASAGTVNAAAADVNVGTVSGTAAVNLAGANAQVTTVSGGTVTLSNTATGSRVNTASAGTVNANAASVSVGTVSNTATVNVGGSNGRVTTMAGGTLNVNAEGLVVTNYNGGNIDVASRTDVTLRGGSSSGVISGQGGITKQGATTLTLSGNNTFTGTTSVEEGRLVVAQGGSLASTTTTVTGSTLTVNGTVAGAVTASSGGVVGGSGTVGTLNILGGGVFAPGNSAGTTTATNGASWSNTGVYNWEIFDLDGPAGTGWDLLSVTGGSLNLAGITTAGGFTINLITLQTNNSTQGALGNPAFDGSSSNLTGWMIASASSIVGFNANNFTLNSSLFVGATGTFAIEERTGGLFVTYTAGGGQPVPEPGTWAAAAMLAGAAGYMRWRRRKEVKPKA